MRGFPFHLHLDFATYLEQSQNAEKEKVTIENVRKKALETLAETKKNENNQKKSNGKSKKSRTTGNETLAYLRENVAKIHEVRMLQVKTQNRGSEGPKIVTWTISSPAATTTANSATNVTTLAESSAGNEWWPYLKNFPKKIKYDLSTADISIVKTSWLRVKAILYVNVYVNYIHRLPCKSTSQLI